MTPVAVVIALAVLGAGASPPLPAPITTAGWGAVRVGMSVRAASAALPGGLRLGKGYTSADECQYRTTSKAPDLLFMVEKGRVVRVETKSRAYVTPSGVRVGDAEAKARQAYEGRAVVRPHKYSPGGLYLVISTADRKAAVVIEIDDGNVVAIRGGLQPAVEYVEGCS